MDWKYLIVIFLSYLTVIQASTTECVQQDNPQIRTFLTLAQYQANKRSFDPREETYIGNFVRFSFDSIHRLEKNSFQTYSAGKVIGLNLSNKSIHVIDEGAFLFLFCLHHLDLSKNNISNLTQNMFVGLENLRKLDLSGNNISYVYDYVFSNLKNLQVLDMSHNNISNLDKYALFNIPTLEKLLLSSNRIKRMQFRYFNKLSNLKELYLDHNEIAMIPVFLFSKNVVLEKLDLSSNGLVLLDMRNDTSVLRSIKNLNLSDNYLITLHIDEIKSHFPNDELTIDMNNNQFYCAAWTQYLKEFKEKHIKIIPGRNFSYEYYIDGIACDTLNSSGNGTDPEDEDPFNAEQNRSNAAQWNQTYDDISRQLKHRQGEFSAKRAKYKDVSTSPDKSPLVDHREGTASSDKVKNTSESDYRTTKGIIIALTVIGTVFVILITLDNVLGVGYTQRVTRRLRRYLTSSSSDDTAEYVTLTPPT